MNLPLMKQTIKKNWILLFIFFCVLAMYSTIMIYMYDPDITKGLLSMFELFPPEFMKAFGFAGSFTDMTTYLASWLYGLLMTGFPMVYCILLGNRLVAKSVESGSMACLLSTPLSRNQVIITKALYAAGSVFLLLFLLFGMNSILVILLFPNDFHIMNFFHLNVTTALVNVVVMSISFFFSCLFNDIKYAIAFGSGVPIGFLLLNMLGNASTKLEVFKKCSIFGWYDSMKIATGNIPYVVNMIYVLIAFTLFISSVIIFKRKRLPL